MTREKEVGCPRVSVPTLFEAGDARVAAACAAAAFAALFAAADPVYGPDYGPTEFTLPGAFATTNFYPVPAVAADRTNYFVTVDGTGNGASFKTPCNIAAAVAKANAYTGVGGATLILSGGVYRVAHYTTSG